MPNHVEHAKGIFYCATCGSFGVDERGNPLGTRFTCPLDKTVDKTHFAATVKPSVGEFWLRVEKWIWMLWRFSPFQLMARGGRAGLYHLLRLGLFIVALALASPDAPPARLVLAVVVAGYFLYDVVLLSSYATFVSRDPAHPLRSLLLNLSSFFQIGIAYSVFYELLAGAFDHVLDRMDAVYFSVITVTTVGYGDVYVVPNNVGGHIVQLLIISELAFGFYVLAGLVAVVAGWANERPPAQIRKTLAELGGPSIVERNPGPDLPRK